MTRRALDAILDSAVLSFAFWTLLYCVGLATQWSLWPSGWVWLVVTIAILVWRLRAAVRAGGEPDSAVSPDQAHESDQPRADTQAGPLEGSTLARLALGVGLVATAFAAVGGLVWSPQTFKPTFVALGLAIVCLLAWTHLTRPRAVPVPRPATEAPYDRRSLLEDLGVLVVMAGCVAASLFIHLADTDDPYYLNRSVWVAEHGNAALEDTMFSPEVLNSAYGGGLPIASVEALFGVLAQMTGTLAGTMTYLVATPVATVLSIWALWRLARRWAPRRVFLVFLASVAFLMLSGDSMLGNFWIVRMWQGKVIAVAFLLPLIWAYLTELHNAPTRRARWRTVAMLLASGVALVGLTPTAVIWAPVMLGAVLLAALVLGSRLLAVGGLAMAVGPLAGGAVVLLYPFEVGGADPVALSARASFVRIFGEVGPMVALGLVALAVAPILARRGAPAALSGAAALASVAVYAPGILSLVNTATGSGPILWRMLYVAPIPVLVGMLAALPVPRFGGVGQQWSAAARVVPVGATLVLVLALVTGGRPIWSHTGHGGPVSVSDRPEWKLDTEALSDVRLLADRGLRGEVLLPPRRMKVLTMYTTDAFPVVPREWFIQNIDEPTSHRRARHLLFDLASGQPPLPGAQRVERALDVLEVDLACTGPSPYRARVIELFRGSGYTSEQSIGSLTCTRRPPS